jgi:ubiquitin carboxyl-terminal hydrolase 48
MSPFLPSSRKEIRYLLKAVLIHSGVSANSGHYISRVWDQSTNCWYNCDDELVEKMDVPHFENQQLDQKEVKSNLRDGRCKSTSAYLLVYERQSTTMERIVPVAPKVLQEYVNKQNNEFDLMLEAQSVLKKEESEMRLLRNELLKELYSIWDDYSDESPCYVSSEELSKVVLSDLPPKEERALTTPELICPHGRISPFILSETKIISKKSLVVLKKLGYNVEPMLDSPCLDCFTALLQNRMSVLQHEQDVEEIKLAKKKNDFWISKTWYTEWKKKRPQFECLVIPRPDDDVYKPDVYCEHGSVAVDSSKRVGIPNQVYKMIQSRFTGFRAPKCTLVCLDCTKQHHIETTVDQEELDRIAIQSVELKRLLGGRKLTLADGAYYLIPTDFLARWRKHIKSPTAFSKPEIINISAFWCEHEKLCYDLEEDKDAFYILTKDEWDCLSHFYQTDGTPIPICIQEERVTSSYESCAHCRLARRLQYKQGKALVMKRDLFTENSTSSRPTKRRKGSRKQESTLITIEPTITVRDIMIQLQEKYETPPLYQKLFFNGQELDHGMTVSQIGALPGDTFEVELFDCEEDFDAVSFEMETGFAGTLLHGSGVNIIDLEKWACPICTFLNAHEVHQCEICGFDQ